MWAEGLMQKWKIYNLNIAQVNTNRFTNIKDWYDETLGMDWFNCVMSEKCLHNDSINGVASSIYFQIINHITSLTRYPILTKPNIYVINYYQRTNYIIWQNWKT